MERSHAVPVLLAAAALLCGAGCVAVPVGSAERWRHAGTVVESSSSAPARSEVVSVDVDCRKAPSGNALRIGLKADVRDTFERTVHDESVTVERQRRLAFGFFPARAEWWWRPEDSLKPTIHTGRQGGGRYPRGATTGSFDWFMYMFYIFSVPATVNSLLYDPLFGRWVVPERDWVDPEFLSESGTDGAFAMVSTRGSPKLRALSRLPHETRREIGVRTYLDAGWWPEDWRGGTLFANCGLFGFHRYATVRVVGPSIENRRTETEARDRLGVAVPGPFSVSVAIPDVGWRTTEGLAAGQRSIDVALPAPERDLAATAVVTFSGSGSQGDRTARDAVARAAGREWRFPVALKAPAASAATIAPIVPSVLTQVVVHVTEPPPPAARTEAPWDIETVEPYADGRAAYLVTIRDAARTAFDVQGEVRPEIERSLREAFCAANPGIAETAVRVHVSSAFGADRTIRLEGVAFSIAPVADGWSYDSDTHRGSVRLRVSAHMRPEDAKRWARENISAIVAEKNVSLEAGAAPPPGATYRSLDESFSGGILSVEFEAVE